MLRLLKLEFTKFRNHSLILILVLLYAIFFPSIIFYGKEFNDLPDPLPGNIIFYKFPTVWDYQGYIGSWLVFFFLGLIAVFSVVNEVRYKTFRQNIIAGLTRKEYFLAKFYAILALSVIATAYYFIVTFLIGAIHTSNLTFGDAFDNSWATTRYFLTCMGYMTFGLMCGFLIRRSGLAVLFYLIYGVAIDPALKWLANSYIVSKFSWLPDGIVRFTPMNVVEDLMPLPLYRFVDLIPDIDFNFEFLLNYTQAMTATILWCTLFLFIIYKNFSTRDL